MTRTLEQQIQALEANGAKLVAEKRELKEQLARERNDHTHEVKKLKAYIAPLEALAPSAAALNARLTNLENHVYDASGKTA
jgi:anti-sigma-K factor RskA